MDESTATRISAGEEAEIQEWVESPDSVLKRRGPEVVGHNLERLGERASVSGVKIPFSAQTPYANTIPLSQQPVFPGDQEIDRRIKSLVRWSALAMVVRANRVEHNIGGHISTFASTAPLFETGFNHFFRARSAAFEGERLLSGSCCARHIRRRFPRGPPQQRAVGEFSPRAKARRRSLPTRTPG